MTDPSPMPADAVRLRLPGCRQSTSEAISAIMDAVEQSGYGRASAFAIRLSLEEAVSNALKHGNRGDESKSISVDYHVSDERVMVAVEDEGEGFNPLEVPDPTLDENIENPSGRGLMLIRAYMTEVVFNDQGNRVVLTYDRPPATDSD